MTMSAFYFACVLCLLPSAFGLYFHLGETEKKCFIEEIPDETMVVGSFAFHVLPKR